MVHRMRKLLVVAGLALIWLFAARNSANAAHRLKLIVPSGYLPGTPFLVRLQVLNEAGDRDWSLWNAEAQLASSDPGMTLSTNRLRLINGLGTVLVAATNGGDFTLTATLGSLQASRSLGTLANQTLQEFGGSLSQNTSWSGLIRLTNDVTVPAGMSLTIQANTWVLIDGAASGTVGNDILVNGSLQILASEEAPATITCYQPKLRWGQIRFTSSNQSLLRGVIITRGGRGTGEGHTGQTPILKLNGANVSLESCSVTDHADASGGPGKIMSADNSTLVFNNCVLARARMGPEIAGTSLLLTNSYVMEMRGPDDSDGFYIHDTGGKPALITHCVVADGQDDGIDTLGATMTVEDCIIRDWNAFAIDDAKGISAGFNGHITVRHCLFAECYDAISAKSSGSQMRVTVDRCTVIGTRRALAAAFKSNATSSNIVFQVTNSIIRAPFATNCLYTDYPLATNFFIGYSALQTNFPGVGNISTDPQFVNASGFDFRLQGTSPCIDAGDPAAALNEPDGSRLDMGYFRFIAPPPTFSDPRLLPGPQFQLAITAFPNRNYIVLASSNFVDWIRLGTNYQSSDTVSFTDTTSAGIPCRFCRGHVAP